MKTIDILNEGFKKRYLKEGKKPVFEDNDDWVNYLTRKLHLNAYEADNLLHDLNNLRADEWLEVIEEAIPENVIEQFKVFFHLNDDEEYFDESYKKRYLNEAKKDNILNQLDKEDYKLIKSIKYIDKSSPKVVIVGHPGHKKVFGIDFESSGMGGYYSGLAQLFPKPPDYSWMDKEEQEDYDKFCKEAGYSGEPKSRKEGEQEELNYLYSKYDRVLVIPRKKWMEIAQGEVPSDFDDPEPEEDEFKPPVEFYYGVYELDEDGDELDHISDFDTEEEAIKFAKKQSFPTHVVFIPSIDPDDDPEIAEYMEYNAPYEAYQTIWSSLNEGFKNRYLKEASSSIKLPSDITQVLVKNGLIYYHWVTIDKDYIKFTAEINPTTGALSKRHKDLNVFEDTLRHDFNDVGYKVLSLKASLHKAKEAFAWPGDYRYSIDSSPKDNYRFRTRSGYLKFLVVQVELEKFNSNEEIKESYKKRYLKESKEISIQDITDFVNSHPQADFKADMKRHLHQGDSVQELEKYMALFYPGTYKSYQWFKQQHLEPDSELQQFGDRIMEREKTLTLPHDFRFTPVDDMEENWFEYYKGGVLKNINAPEEVFIEKNGFFYLPKGTELVLSSSRNPYYVYYKIKGTNKAIGFLDDDVYDGIQEYGYAFEDVL